MDTERNLLFGVVALQAGAVDPGGLSETCADWASEPSRTLADLLVDRGLITVEQRAEIEETVVVELASHGGDPRATLAATVDARSLEALGDSAATVGMTAATVERTGAASQSGAGQGAPHVVIGRLAPGEPDALGRLRYTRTHLHARGGMGRVWLARDGSLGRQIALKELRPEQADNAVVCSRFLYEARITAQLEHPGIVPVYELGEGDAPYYTMRFVRGRTLSEAARAYHKRREAGQADPVELVDLLSSFAAVCHAVAYAHSRGIIHRDLKGQNVVLGDFGEVIVLDWGLAKRVGPDPSTAPGPAGPAPSDGAPEAASGATMGVGLADVPTVPPELDGGTGDVSVPDPEATCAAGPEEVGVDARAGGPAGLGLPGSGAGPEGTMQGQVLGTPAYMAPEQAEGRHDLVDRRTDIYGLGAILYDILAGRPPFVAPRSVEILQMVRHEEPTPPRQLVFGIAPGLEAVCLKALSKDPAGRYQSASELAQEIRRYLADEPVRAYPEPWTRRASRWARRNRTKVAAAAGLLAAATVALAVGTVLVARERDEAEAQGRRARRAVHLLARGADIAFDDQLDAVQEEMLRDALAYYEEFTGRSSRDPSARLEHGRADLQMGDIQRKLGRLAESEAAYRRAIAVLEPLAVSGDKGREASRSLARARALLAALLVRRGSDAGQADRLYAQAAEAQRALADAPRDPADAAEDRLRLGQTEKGQGDLLRLGGRLDQAAAAYDRAIAALERASADAGAPAEARTELARALDARGFAHRERGEAEAAEADYRRAVEMLEGLVAAFPTVPRHREALARALNSLALLEQDTGRLADAEAHLLRERPMAERLAQDFPDRPEYRRILARTLTNLGAVLIAQRRLADAEPVFRRAVEVNAEISARSPDDVQIRLDLARAHVGLGEVLRQKGEAEPAVASLRVARPILEAMVRDFPGQPRYRDLLAQDLVDLALATQAADPGGAEKLYRDAQDLFDKLVADFPDHIDYRIGQARCLQNQGAALASAGRADRAEASYRRALAQLDAGPAGVDPRGMQTQAEVLNNLGNLLQRLGRPEAEAVFLRAQGLFTELASRSKATIGDRHNLAITRYNLGETLLGLKRLADAEAALARASADFEKLVGEAPRSVDFRSQLGLVLGLKADVLTRAGRLPEASAVLAQAIGHEERAVQLGRNRGDTRALLGNLLLERAKVDLDRGAYQDAAEGALRAPRAVPESGRGRTYFDAATILARVVGRVGGDPELVPADRERLIRPYLGHTLVMLREAMDIDPATAGRIKGEPAIKALESRPEFRTTLGALIDPGR